MVRMPRYIIMPLNTLEDCGKLTCWPELVAHILVYTLPSFTAIDAEGLPEMLPPDALRAELYSMQASVQRSTTTVVDIEMASESNK
jgi:hypothetical protein